jgi:hypothetical protein
VDLAKTRFTNINNQTGPRKPNNGFAPPPCRPSLDPDHILNLNLSPFIPSMEGIAS